MSTIELIGLDHVVLRVSDLARSMAFYCDVLGCREERRIEELGLFQLRAGSALIDLVTVDSPLGRAGGPAAGKDGHNVDHFALRIARLDSGVEQALRDAGLEPGPIAPRYGAEGTGPSLYLQDPDGTTVELKGPPES